MAIFVHDRGGKSLLYYALRYRSSAQVVHRRLKVTRPRPSAATSAERNFFRRFNIIIIFNPAASTLTCIHFIVIVIICNK